MVFLKIGLLKKRHHKYISNNIDINTKMDESYLVHPFFLLINQYIFYYISYIKYF
jgi:hypothetical protein